MTSGRSAVYTSDSAAVRCIVRFFCNILLHYVIPDTPIHCLASSHATCAHAAHTPCYRYGIIDLSVKLDYIFDTRSANVFFGFFFFFAIQKNQTFFIGWVRVRVIKFLRFHGSFGTIQSAAITLTLYDVRNTSAFKRVYVRQSVGYDARSTTVSIRIVRCNVHS